jgi:hypothetical protein
MNTSLPTLSGLIPGLLRRGPPVVATERRGKISRGDRGLVICVSGDAAWAECFPTSQGRLRENLIALDLSDPTGRAHAAWWLHEQERENVDQFQNRLAASGLLDADVYRAMNEACANMSLLSEQVEFLRLACLHVAGFVP